MGLIKIIKGKLLKFFTKKQKIDFDLKNTKKILFFRYDRIGDMIITTPVFRELKKAYPNIEVSVLASNVNKGILANNDYIDKIYINDKHNFLSDLKVLFKLRKEQFDVVVEFDHSVIPHAIFRLKIINPKKIISVKKDGRYGVSGTDLQIYDFYTDAPIDAHFRDIWLNTLKPFGITIQSNKYDIFFTKEQNKVAKLFLEHFDKKIKIGINLEGAVKGKKITYDKLEQICNGLYKKSNNIQIVILTTPQKYDEVSTIIKDINLDCVSISYKTESILDVSALISNLDLIITPDTSIVHIASAFDKPLVTIHENNKDSYRLFAPTSELNYTVFSKDVDSLTDFSIDELLQYSFEIIERIDNKRI
jgi:ADP-heptose:LPS heptosyltransferase